MRLIDADAAIDALKELTANGTNKGMVFGEDAVHRIEILPSVQPNHCAEVGKKVLIDRQEALEAIGTMQTYKLFAGDDMLLIDQAEAQTELMMLPSVQPERKIGRWIPDNTDYYRTKFICSACGESEEVPTTGFGYGAMWGYCPNCGAKMERRQDGH